MHAVCAGCVSAAGTSSSSAGCRPSLPPEIKHAQEVRLASFGVPESIITCDRNIKHRIDSKAGLSWAVGRPHCKLTLVLCHGLEFCTVCIITPGLPWFLSPTACRSAGQNVWHMLYKNSSNPMQPNLVRVLLA